jgi:AcrR family transcriptional regulator
MTTSTAARPPGRPRSLRVDEAIIDAVLDLLAEGTAVEALSMEAVASRAGVGKAAIYRRWPHKNALVLEAVASLKAPIPELPGTSVREDLVMIAGVIADSQGTRMADVMPCLMPELQRHGPLRDEYLALIERRRDVTRAVIRRGIKTGELKPDTDIELVVAMISGPMMMSMLGSSPRLNRENLAERLVGAVFAGIAD